MTPRTKFHLAAFFSVCLAFHDCKLAVAAVAGFSETFSGVGEHTSSGLELVGLDNPGWQLTGSEMELTESGLSFKNMPVGGIGERDVVQDRLIMPLTGAGSFRETLIIRNLDLGDLDPSVGLPPTVGTSIQFSHRASNDGGLSETSVITPGRDADSWRFAITIGREPVVNRTIPRVENLMFGLSLDWSAKTTTFEFDENIDDADPPTIYGPFDFTGEFDDSIHRTTLRMGVVQAGRADGIVEHWSLVPFSNVVGDFNGNDVLGISDLDLLSAAIRSSDHDQTFDLNADTLVDATDLGIWVQDLANTYFGDANLDGEFASSDLVNVFVAGEYEDDIAGNSTWATGDWNADGDFTSSDIVLAFEDGGYEQGPRAAVVPEPSVIVLVIVGLGCCFTHRR